MVNWKEVERLRARGLDWASVAESPAVQFTAPDGVEDAGRALKTLYLTRKSQRSRRSRGGPVAGEGPTEEQVTTGRRSKWLLSAGLLLLSGAAVWSVVAKAVPAPFGIEVTFLPDLVLGLLVALGLLGAAFLLGISDLRGAWVKPVTVGIVLGLVGVGLSGFVAIQQGAPVLQPPTPYGNGFDAENNALWMKNGRPVVFFMGSAACPYCSATSWAIRGALDLFGGLDGAGFTTSSPTDSAGPNTPEVTLYGTSVGGSYLYWMPAEDSDNQVIQQPALTVVQQSYVAAYDEVDGESGSIPFLVFGGQYSHAGTFVEPGSLTTGGQVGTTPYTPAQINGQLNNQSGPAYNAIITYVYLLCAYFVKIDQAAHISPPSSVLALSPVQQDLQTIPAP
ncbi:MAG: DUF929 family protein [Thermoplasmata archaeon]